MKIKYHGNTHVIKLYFKHQDDENTKFKILILEAEE